MTEYVKVKAITAQELLDQFELYEEGAEAHLVPDTAPQISIERLAEAGFYLDAIKLLAHGLPKRESVWWSCLAARAVQKPDTDEDNINALIAAEAWAKAPTEENRLRCRLLGEKTKHKTAASWAATAACWSTGSMAAEGEPEIQTPEYLFAHAVAGAVSIAATEADGDNLDEFYKKFLLQGIDLARGGNGQTA